MGTGKTVGTVGGAVAGSYFGPVGTVVGGYLGGAIGGMFDGKSGPPPPDANNFRLNGGPGGQMTQTDYIAQNQKAEGQALRANSVATGLRGQQQSQVAGDAALQGSQGQGTQALIAGQQQQQRAQNLGQGALQQGQAQAQGLNAQSNQMYAQGDAMQGRTAALAQTDLADKQRQLQALGAQQNSADSLQAMGQAPMGDSYAAAQLKQGQDAAMNQSLAMAKSGRSLGGGAAAMQQAQMQNAQTNQVTNQQAGVARIQEQNAYKQQQLQALGAAQQGYQNVAGQANTLRGAGDQMNQFNSTLQQNQQGVNNQTQSVYNQAAGQQAQLGLGYQQSGQNAAVAYDQMGNQAAQAGQQANLGFNQLGQQTDLGYNQLGAQQNLGFQQLGSQQNQFYSQQGENTKNTQLNANMALENLKAGNSIAGMEQQNKENAANASMISGIAGVMSSDIRNKTDIVPLEQRQGAGMGQGARAAHGRDAYIQKQMALYDALGGGQSARPDVRQPDTAALDAAYVRQAPAIDLRPAQGYAYNYKDPTAPGTAPGRQVGPMAQDLERSGAADAVVETQNGKGVDPGRLTLKTTAAVSEQQKKIDALQRQLDALTLPQMDRIQQAPPGTYALNTGTGGL